MLKWTILEKWTISSYLGALFRSSFFWVKVVQSHPKLNDFGFDRPLYLRSSIYGKFTGNTAGYESYDRDQMTLNYILEMQKREKSRLKRRISRLESVGDNCLRDLYRPKSYSNDSKSKILDLFLFCPL